MSENVNHLPLIRLHEAPEIFIDGYHGAALQNGVVKLNVFSTVFDPVSEQMSRVATARLVMSISTLVAMAQSLHELIANLERDGVFGQVGQPEGQQGEQG